MVLIPWQEIELVYYKLYRRDRIIHYYQDHYNANGSAF